MQQSPSSPKMWTPVRKPLRIRQDGEEKRFRADVGEKLREAQSRVEAQANSEETGKEQLRNLWAASATASWGRLRATAEEFASMLFASWNPKPKRSDKRPKNMGW